MEGLYTQGQNVDGGGQKAEVMRDADGNITEVRWVDTLTRGRVSSIKPCTPVLIENDGELGAPKFLAVVDSLLEVDDELYAHIFWLYRTSDFPNLKKVPKKHLKLPGTLVVHHEGGADEVLDDEGLTKEVYMSGHAQDIPVGSIMHDVKVHFMPGVDDAADHAALSVNVPLETPGSGPASTLLPGFVCRAFLDTKSFKTIPLGRCGKQVEANGADMVRRLLARSAAALPPARAAHDAAMARLDAARHAAGGPMGAQAALLAALEASKPAGWDSALGAGPGMAAGAAQGHGHGDEEEEDPAEY